MAPESEITLGEVGRRLDLLHSDFRDFQKAMVKQSDLGNVADGWKMALENHEKYAEEKFARQQKEIDALQAWQTWAMRLVVGAVVLAVIGAFIVLPSR